MGENESVRFRQHLILQLLLVIAAFIWQANIGCYVNGLIVVEEKPKILTRFWQRKSWDIWNSCNWSKNNFGKIYNSQVLDWAFPCLHFCLFLLLLDVSSVEFLHSFLKRHFAGKPVVASRNVNCFLWLRVTI